MYKNPALLIAEPVELAAVRAMPGDAVAGKMLDIDVHAGLADGKPAPAGPAKRGDLATAMADSVPGAAATLPALLNQS
jgi:hypothetical protein